MDGCHCANVLLLTSPTKTPFSKCQTKSASAPSAGMMKVLVGLQEYYAQLPYHLPLWHVQPHTPFIDLIDYVKKYAVTLELQYTMHLRQDLTSDIAGYMQSSRLIPCFAKLLLKNHNVFTFVPEQISRNRGGPVLGLIQPDRATFFQ